MAVDGPALLDRLSQVEAFEQFLHRAFPGKTRFSVEGLDMLVPILDAIVDAAGGAGSSHVLIGMAHRGRLNVLAHTLSKPYAQILAEFKDPVQQRAGYRIDLGWAGDVKYHAGARRSVKSLTVSMAPNPSHLEFVNPVVAGMARAAGTTVNHARPVRVRFEPDAPPPDSWRRRVSRTGDRRRDAEPGTARRLRYRRHDSHHREQPAGVHGHVTRVATARCTRATWRAASRFPSSTSTPTIPRRASKRRDWRRPIGASSVVTSSSI